MDLTAVRQGLCDLAGTIDGLRTDTAQLNSINPPLFVIYTLQRTFDSTFGRGVDELLARCRIYASTTSDRAGIAKLDGYLAGSGDLSLKQALESDRDPTSGALGGACFDLRVEQTSEWPTVYALGNAEQTFYGADLTVRIWGPGD